MLAPDRLGEGDALVVRQVRRVDPGKQVDKIPASRPPRQLGDQLGVAVDVRAQQSESSAAASTGTARKGAGAAALRSTAGSMTSGMGL
ncbi:MAG: hypothetical protein AVDCRST_MAG21-1025 [uncultured Nocardioidaceae bacterium]|uniref:Uncharacterized protein n=1 Tax=uncultured Nocardioidaceae bacterium TaxID=253824 RepID=A0A6J4N2G8_9ACTN|nr:MAG: hypothetical protein AVDCRST_MAG21-1025 [uncultured Nocardioidaceae bacterium]